jgi:hypothetical protein
MRWTASRDGRHLPPHECGVQPPVDPFPVAPGPDTGSPGGIKYPLLLTLLISQASPPVADNFRRRLQTCMSTLRSGGRWPRPRAARDSSSRLLELKRVYDRYQGD